MTEGRIPYDPNALWANTERENACGDASCEMARREAALLVLRGGKTHRQYADVIEAAIRVESPAVDPEGALYTLLAPDLEVQARIDGAAAFVAYAAPGFDGEDVTYLEQVLERFDRLSGNTK